MTTALSQLTDLQRVRITLSGWNTSVTSVKVERSLNELLWMTVRGGVELPVDTGDGQLDDFEWFDGQTNHYRVTTVDPAPGMLLDGTGDYASTPDDASLDIAGDIWLAAYARADDWASGSAQNLPAKYRTADNERAYEFQVTASGELHIFWSTDGSTFESATSTVDITDLVSNGEWLALGVHLDVDDGSGGWVVTFYTAPALGGPWTQLGDAVDNSGGGTTSINNSAAPLEVGRRPGGGQEFAGIIGAVEVRSGDMSGTLVADPDFTSQPSGTSSFDDDAGRTWTLNGDAEIVSFETASIVPDLGDLPWLKSIRYPFLNRQLPRVLLRDPSIGRRSRDEEFPVTGRSVGVATSDLRLGQQFTLSVLVEDNPLEWARDMDLILAAGGIFFIHTPADWPGPGGYVIIGESRQLPVYGGSESPQEFTLPCTVVAPPSPLVVGTLLTWGTVERLYGSWEALVAANPTWIDLLDTVGSPEDLVTL